jgi:hypothetical protein
MMASRRFMVNSLMLVSDLAFRRDSFLAHIRLSLSQRMTM